MKVAGFVSALLLSLPATAQLTGSDSIYFFTQSNNAIHFSQSNATQLWATDLSRSGLAELGVSRTGGSFRRPQEAQYNTTVHFYSEGFNTIGRFKLAGGFYFNKVWDDSLAWTMQGRKLEAEPYYFFAGKAGSYERQTYEMNALASYALITDRLFLGAGVNYNYYWTTRSVDPRPEVSEWMVRFHPELSYKKGNHTAGISLLWGKSREGNDISYKNRMYAGNAVYTERNSYLSVGYGNMEKQPKSLQRFITYSGIGVHYGGQWRNWAARGNVDYELEEEENTVTEGESLAHHSIYAIVQNDKLNGSLLLEQHTPSYSRQFTLQWASQKAVNWSQEYNGTNYQYLSKDLSLQYLHRSVKRRAAQPEWGVGLSWRDVLREDVIAAHYSHVHAIQPSITGGMYHRLGSGDWISWSLSPSLRLPLGNTLTVPASQETYFTTGIIYPDYLYDEATALCTGATIRYLSKKLLSNLDMGILLKASQELRLKEAPGSLPVTASPGKSRYTVSLGINLYL